MITTSWNIRGLNDSSKILIVKDHIRVNGISVIDILETRVKAENAMRIRHSINIRLSWEDNYVYSHTGHICLGWN